MLIKKGNTKQSIFGRILRSKIYMKRKTVKPFFATINFGLKMGYTDQKIEKSKVIECIQHYQDQLIKRKNSI